ncbi:MAG: 23S rRNA (uracil(1939)-C(5))-methyltransferase RlmD [Candidatus Cyclonatronum sp.]|uniref:23S rRNA (uracil(1939)-C(5))-methyltransferase RlmD n=1 Tax=Cyclonatronum sp. TaxID=3024185 RepID=UPI0025B94D38|nr:23S rRNA (uracil(1939)-C(5))-methyltransferase RlmD [Cyclonatronum sp.]MCH8485904.1 23S rRNA (uracil(1939)-C(5))-methyltransferase RlmD [Cyclonatronum sp.]
MAVKKGHTAELTIESAAFEGKGFGRLEDRACFVKNTAPGDHVKVRIIKKRKSFFEGQLIEVLKEGPDRVQPVCRHASVCGGCTWQHVSYAEQLRFKRQHVEDHLHRIGGLRDVIPLPVLAAPQQLHYRNKMEYSFGDRRWLTREEIDSGITFTDKDVAAGMHAPGRFDRILNLEECHLQVPVSFEIMDFVRSYALKHDISSYNPVKKQGFIRHVMVRNGHHTGDLMVNLVTFADRGDIVKPLAEALLARFPQITTIVNNVNDTPSPSSEGRFENVLFGPGYITEKLGANLFRIDANTFFQTNTLQAGQLYETARQFADLRPDDLLFDLYCGVGSLTLYTADAVKQAVGIELSPVSVENARKNAAANNVVNCAFETGDMKDVFTGKFIQKYGRPDVIITDPPRAGMHPDVVKTLCELAVDRLIYVSCNSATMARDLAELSRVYTIDRVQPVDMFPQTYHIETVARLTRRFQA